MKMPGGIAEYFEQIDRLLVRSRVVQSQDVHAQKRTLTEGFLRGDVLFRDGSRLHFRELVTTEPSVLLVSYTYQYMRPDGKLIFRYDDTDHYLNFPSAPYHKHLGETDVIAADPPDLAMVLREIEGLIAANSSW